MCCLPLSFDIFYTLKNMSKTQSEHNIILTYDLIKIMISNFLGGISQMLPENLVHNFLIGANVHLANPHQAFFQFFPRNFAPCSPVPETHPHPAVDTLSLSTAHLGSIAVSWTGGHLGGAGALGRPGALSGEGGGVAPPGADGAGVRNAHVSGRIGRVSQVNESLGGGAAMGRHLAAQDTPSKTVAAGRLRSIGKVYWLEKGQSSSKKATSATVWRFFHA